MKHVLGLISSVFISLNAFSATFIVTSTTGNSGTTGSLAWAIQQANANGTGADIISFSGIPAGTTIIQGTDLPTITGQVHIDGSTWPGYVVDGAHLSVNVNSSFNFENAGANGSRIDGLSIVTGGTNTRLVNVNNADNVTIEDNYFKIGSNGSTVDNDQAQQIIQTEQSNNTVINNNIFNLENSDAGIEVRNNSTNTVITNNNFGVAVNNTTEFASAGPKNAIKINGADEVRIEGNIIVNSTESAINLEGNASNIDILNNFIGVLGNGTTPGSVRNGVTMTASSINTVLIQGNVIGNTTNESIKVENYPSTITIDGNRIINSSNHGIQVLGASNMTITNNIIGENANGTPAGVNNSGITLTNIQDVTITGNTIANSGLEGIWYDNSNASANIQNNSISCSFDEPGEEGKGIEGCCSYPAPTLLTNNGMTVTGTSGPNARIDVYRKDPLSACANCEGEIWMGSTTANGAGNWTFTHNSGWPNGSTSGLVSATASYLVSGKYRTSEFADPDGTPRTGCLPVSGALSVEIYSFIVNKGIIGNHLRWITAMPENGEYFIIERSDNGSSNFESIGELYPNTSTTFNFIDTEPLIGVNYYRIKQIDASNAITYSEIIKVYDSESSNSKLVSIYPNPTQNKMVFFKLDHSLIDPSLSLKVFSSIGQLVKEINSFNGDFIDLSDHPQGAYLVVITTDAEVISKPIILQ